MKIKKKLFIIVVLASFMLLGSGLYIYRNIPLRTAVFRTVLKGNWYITSEKDTLYSFGYYGVKKLLQSNELEELNRNNEICNNTFIGGLVARSGVLFDQYIYVACRSFYPYNTSSNKNYVNALFKFSGKRDNIIPDARMDNAFNHRFLEVNSSVCNLYATCMQRTYISHNFIQTVNRK